MSSRRITPMTEAEQIIVATQIATMRWIMIGRVPDHLIKSLDRMVGLMKLPKPARMVGHDHPWDPSREELRASERLTEDEVNILTEWIDAISEIFNGRVPAAAIDAYLKFERELYGLIRMPERTKKWWRSSARRNSPPTTPVISATPYKWIDARDVPLRSKHARNDN